MNESLPMPELPTQGASANAGVYCEFFNKLEQMGVKTKEAGRPIFEEIEYVKLIPVGDRTTVIERPATDFDRKRFPREYYAFRQGAESQISGTPLIEWPLISRTQAEELKYFKIVTVEQLAEVADSNLSNVMGGNGLKQKAKAYLEAARGEEPLRKVQAELEERDNRIALLEARLSALADKFKDEEEA